MSRKRLIAVLGASAPTAAQVVLAEAAGRAIAGRGWVLVTGGLGGVMEAASRGAAAAGGEVVGILPTPTAAEANASVTIPIVTNMGHARNVIICHTAEGCIAIGRGAGTLSEIAIARKLGKPVVGCDSWDVLDCPQRATAEEAVALLATLLP